jgi:hypothetical protein
MAFGYTHTIRQIMQEQLDVLNYCSMFSKKGEKRVDRRYIPAKIEN